MLPATGITTCHPWPSDSGSLAGRHSSKRSPKRSNPGAAAASVHWFCRRCVKMPDNKFLLLQGRHDSHESQREKHGRGGLQHRAVPGDVPQVVSHVPAGFASNGMGVISMKLAGEGNVRSRRRPQKPPCASPSRNGRSRLGRHRRPTKTTAPKIDEAIENLDLRPWLKLLPGEAQNRPRARR